MPEETQTTTDESANNTGETTATTTATESQTQAQIEKTFTQADVDRIVADRLKREVKKELKKLAGDSEGQPSLEELQQQLKDATERLQGYETSHFVREYLTDPKHKLGVRSENIAAVEKLVKAEIVYEDGKPTNLKEAVETVKSYAPILFAAAATNINQGNTGQAVPKDMNAFIREQHAAKN